MFPNLINQKTCQEYLRITKLIFYFERQKIFLENLSCSEHSNMLSSWFSKNISNHQEDYQEFCQSFLENRIPKGEWQHFPGNCTDFPINLINLNVHLYFNHYCYINGSLGAKLYIKFVNKDWIYKFLLQTNHICMQMTFLHLSQNN